MVSEVEISPEIAKLAKQRLRGIGSSLSAELCRAVVEETVYQLDPQENLVINESAAYSQYDALVAAFDVNDVVVNDTRLDVRGMDADGRVSMSRALIATGYLSNGSIAVVVNADLKGKAVAFISAKQWQAADRDAGSEQVVFVKPDVDAAFDLAKLISAATPDGKESQAVPPPKPADLAAFVANRSDLSIDKQRHIVESTLANESFWGELSAVVSIWSMAKVDRVLSDSAIWNARLERLSDILERRFKRLKRKEITSIVAKLAETHGGQPEAPAFRQALLQTLTKQELSLTLGAAVLSKANQIAEAVLSGRASAEAIKEVIKNPVAVQIASEIKKQRRNLSQFVDASAQELTSAFQQLALQPAYATHSADPASGMEAINEALQLIDAAALVEGLKDIDQEIANV